MKELENLQANNHPDQMFTPNTSSTDGERNYPAELSQNAKGLSKNYVHQQEKSNITVIPVLVWEVTV